MFSGRHSDIDGLMWCAVCLERFVEGDGINTSDPSRWFHLNCDRGSNSSDDEPAGEEEFIDVPELRPGCEICGEAMVDPAVQVFNEIADGMVHRGCILVDGSPRYVFYTTLCNVCGLEIQVGNAFRFVEETDAYAHWDCAPGEPGERLIRG
jgi:hypothetical protein